jgi:hypothetical protein
LPRLRRRRWGGFGDGDSARAGSRNVRDRRSRVEAPGQPSGRAGGRANRRHQRRSPSEARAALRSATAIARRRPGHRLLGQARHQLAIPGLFGRRPVEQRRERLLGATEVALPEVRGQRAALELRQRLQPPARQQVVGTGPNRRDHDVTFRMSARSALVSMR